MTSEPNPSELPPEPWARARRLRFAIAAALALITLALFWPVQRYDFVNLDDPSYVSANPIVREGLSWSSIQWAFTSRDPHAGNPVTTLSYLADAELFGINAAAFHRTNLLLHVCNTVLLFFLLARLTQTIWPSALVAALFAWHPLHVEPVAWISARKDLASGLFWLAALWFYTGYAQARDKEPAASTFPARAAYALSLISFTLGLMAKTTIVTLPFLLLLLDYWPLRRFPISRRLVFEKVPFLLIGMAASAWVFLLQKQAGTIPSLGDLSWSNRLATALIAYVRYLGKLFWPADLAIFYPHPGTWPAWQVIGSALVLVALTVFFISLMRSKPYLAVGWFWFMGMLLPVIGILQIGVHSLADRYTYLPLIGLFILLVWGGRQFVIQCKFSRWLIALIIFIPLLACCVMARRQLAAWRDSESAMQHALRVTTGNYYAFNNLGIVRQGQGRADEAADLFLAALRYNPTFAEAQVNLGIARERQGKTDEAVHAYAAALTLNPRHAEAHNNLGILYQRQGRWEEAAACYREALRQKPHLADAHFNLGIVLEGQGKLDEAIASYRAAAQRDSAHAEAQNNLGALLQQQGRWEEALPCFAAAIRARPDFAEAYFNQGFVLERLGRVDLAIANYLEAVRFKPSMPEAHSNAANLLARQQRWELAIKHYRAALQLKPDMVDALNNLAWILTTESDARFRDGAQAAQLAARAVALTRTNYPAALDTLAAAYAERGQFSNAVATAKEAIRLAMASENKALAEDFEKRLRIYEKSQAYRKE